MEHTKFKVRDIKGKIAAFLVGFIMLSLLISFLFVENKIADQKKKLDITNRYFSFEDRIHNFLFYNSNLIKGFSAYIQTYNQYNENDVYTYLSHLLDNSLIYIRNIGIIKGTTIIWNFPKKENEKSIGVDLSKVPMQAESIKRTKATLKSDFEGPVNLVQGGTGYIMRVPIIKNNRYWGIVSIVLKADKVKEMLSEYENKYNINVVIFNKTYNNRWVYGNRSILQKNPIMFNSSFNGGEWSVYVISTQKQTQKDYVLRLLVVIAGVIITILASKGTYKYVQMTEEMRRKNTLLSRDIVKDMLTGIYNRSYLDTKIIEETKRVNRYDGKLSMIYFDLDHFKVVNDTYGHEKGDAVLKKITLVVSSKIRGSDIFARWGGEEFAILMPNTDFQSAMAVAEKLRASIELTVHPAVGKVTASFGVAEYIPNECIVNWFNRADNELYRAKTNGRNRVSGHKTISQNNMDRK